jgi:hypothetical protein
MGDNITNKIPKPIMFRNKVVKKLYNEQNLEYSDGISDVNDVAYHDNYTRNLGLQDYAPEIAQSISDLAKAVKEEKPICSTSVVTTSQVLEIIKLLAEQNKETASGLTSVVTFMKSLLPQDKKDDDIPFGRPDYFG